jgi:hypothetical protein
MIRKKIMLKQEEDHAQAGSLGAGSLGAGSLGAGSLGELMIRRRAILL